MKNKFFTFDDLRPISHNPDQFGNSINLKVIGVGGIGCKVINRLNEIGMQGVGLIAVDSDIHNLLETKADSHIHIWEDLSGEKGANQEKNIRQKIVKELTEKLSNEIKDSGFIVVVSGLGGTVSADTLPIIGDIAKELGLLNFRDFYRTIFLRKSSKSSISQNMFKKFRKARSYIDSVSFIRSYEGSHQSSATRIRAARRVARGWSSGWRPAAPSLECFSRPQNE